MAVNNNKSSGTDRLNNQLLATLETRRELTCIASVSVRVWRESWDESKKKEWRGRGRGEKFLLFPSPSLFHFFCSRSNFRAITRLETLAAQARRELEPKCVPQWFLGSCSLRSCHWPIFPLSLNTVSKAFARVNSSQFLSRFKSGEFPAKS